MAKFTKTEKQLIDWITGKWESRWIESHVIGIDSEIDIATSQSLGKACADLCDKDIFSFYRTYKNKNKVLCLDVGFYPIQLIIAYNGVILPELKDPLGNKIEIESMSMIDIPTFE